MSTKNLVGVVLVLAGILMVGTVVLYDRMHSGPASNSNPAKGSTMQTSVSGGIQHASDANFQQLVLQSSSPVLVDFYAQWCGPCKMLAPVLEEIAREKPQARIVKVDVDASPATAARYGISSIPTLIVFENGAPGRKTVGLASKAQLQNMLGL